MRARELAEAIVEEWEGVKPSDGNWYQVKNLCGDIEAAIIAAVRDEREACAKLCEVEAGSMHPGTNYPSLLKEMARQIRARTLNTSTSL